MADEPQVNLEYTEGCGACGKRHVELPAPLPVVGDDFDWDVRDYDGFRLFMLEELAARFPERRNWTPADMEVVLVETLSVVLDQLADMNDRIQAESFLETARRPDTVRRMLEMIGYGPANHVDKNVLLKLDPIGFSGDLLILSEEKLEILWAYYPALMNDAKKPDGSLDNLKLKKIRYQALLDGKLKLDNHELERLWGYYPELMDEAKLAGPRSIHQQHRMVTQEDYRNQLLAHPLVLDIDAYSRWTGSWYTHFLVVRLINNLELDDVLSKEKIVPDAQGPVELDDGFKRFNEAFEEFYQQQEIEDIPDVEGKTSRYLLQDIIKRQRMIGQEVVLQDATLVGIVLSISVRIAGDYYRSEIDDAVRAALVDQSDGFFAPGYLQFGEDVVASDIIESLMILDGVESVCINRMKRIGSIYADQSGSGRIVLEGHEVAVLEDNIEIPERGSLKVTLHGGKPG